MSKPYPVIFVPGLFGSMSDEIIPGTGGWHFGLAGIVYEPFIKLLQETLNLQLNENLFIAFYDWRKPIEHSAKKYLFKKIQEVKKHTKAKKVRIICHSMGGLVTRSYVQSHYYKKDVDQIFMIATPNAGSPPNYCYWAAGYMPLPSDHVNLVHLYMKGYLWLLEKEHPNQPITSIHEQFQGLENILPCSTYGSYLLQRNEIEMKWITYENMETKNIFLDKLNRKAGKIKSRGISLAIVAGVGEQTVEAFITSPYHTTDKWVDGKVIEGLTTYLGDSNATMKSVLSIEGKHYCIKGTHNELLFKSLPLIADEFNVALTTSPRHELETSYTHYLIEGCGVIQSDHLHLLSHNNRHFVMIPHDHSIFYKATEDEEITVHHNMNTKKFTLKRNESITISF